MSCVHFALPSVWTLLDRLLKMFECCQFAIEGMSGTSFSSCHLEIKAQAASELSWLSSLQGSAETGYQKPD